MGREEVVTQINVLKKSAEASETELSKLQKNGIESIKRKIAEQDSKMRRLEKAESEIKSSLQDLLIEHDQNVAGKLKAYGEDLKAALRDSLESATTTTKSNRNNTIKDIRKRSSP